MASLLGLRPRHPLDVAAVLVDWCRSHRLFLLRLVELDGRVPEAALRVAQVAARYRRVEVDLVLGRGGAIQYKNFLDLISNSLALALFIIYYVGIHSYK